MGLKGVFEEEKFKMVREKARDGIEQDFLAVIMLQNDQYAGSFGIENRVFLGQLIRGQRLVLPANAPYFRLPDDLYLGDVMGTAFLKDKEEKPRYGVAHVLRRIKDIEEWKKYFCFGDANRVPQDILLELDFESFRQLMPTLGLGVK